MKALGQDIAKATGRRKPLTDGAISQWLSGATRRVSLENLRGLSTVTGEPFENLERMVYGNAVSGDPPARRTSDEAGVYLTRSELDAMLERAALRALETLRDEGWAPSPAGARSAVRPRPSKP